MGALGAALLVRESKMENGEETSFRGLRLCEAEIAIDSFTCSDCPNHCEVVTVLIGQERISGWGDRCGKWQHLAKEATG